MSRAKKINLERSEPTTEQRFSKGLSNVDSDLAQNLDPNTRVVSLKTVIDSLHIYQHFNTGEIMILVNETLTNETKNVEDYSEWNSVYLHADNTDYLKSLGI